MKVFVRVCGKTQELDLHDLGELAYYERVRNVQKKQRETEWKSRAPKFVIEP